MLKWKKSAAVIVAAMLIQTLPQGFVTAGAESVSKPYDSTVRVFENFEGYANEGAEGETLFTGTTAKKTYKLGSYLGLTVEGENNKVEIVTDPATNSKAMKLTYSGEGSIVLENFFHGNANPKDYGADVIAKSGCKAKFEHYASHSWLKTFNAIVDYQNWYGIARIIGYGDSLAIAGKDGRLNTFADGMTSKYSHEYLSTELLYNSQSKNTVITEPNKEVKIIGNNTHLPGEQRFELSDKSKAVNANYCGPDDAANPTVIWLDDLYFEIIDFNVKHINVGGFAAEKSPADIPVNAPIEVRFNDDCGDSALNKDNYSLTDASGNAVDFEIQRADGKNIRILPQKQAMGVKYTFTVKAGIAAAADDNVVVLNDNTVTYTTSESGLIFKGYVEDLRFDDWEDTIVEMKNVASGSDAYTALDGKIRLQRANAADSVSIETDPTTKSKALRIKRNATGSPETRCLLVLPNAYESGKIVVNLDMRVVEMPNGGSMLNFGSSTTEGTSSKWYNIIYSPYWYANNQASGNWGNSGHFEGKPSSPVMMSIDYTNNKFIGEVYRDYSDTKGYQQRSWDFGTPNRTDGTQNVKYMVLGQVSGSKGDIWYDNIRVAYYDYMNLEVEDISIPDTRAAIDDAITLTFNAEVSDDDLTTEKIGIITEVDGDFVKVDCDIKKDGNKVILTPKEKLNYNASYMVNIPQGLTAKTANVKPTENDYMYSFTTAAKDIGFDKMSAKLSEDKNTVTVSGELYSISGQDTEYQIIAAVYDESGRLVTAARGNSGTLSKNSVADINISLAAGESGKVVKVFAWSGLNDMSPIIGNQELDCGK
mgnify:FL=1